MPWRACCSTRRWAAHCVEQPARGGDAGAAEHEQAEAVRHATALNVAASLGGGGATLPATGRRARWKRAPGPRHGARTATKSGLRACEAVERRVMAATRAAPWQAHRVALGPRAVAVAAAAAAVAAAASWRALALSRPIALDLTG
uniref:Uncharacterized protein n=1 Tax=Oryza barthii TaxID=65489 RepID=A0A0D3EMA4_9ORYZ